MLERRCAAGDRRRGATLRKAIGKRPAQGALEDGHLDRSRATAARRSSRPSASAPALVARYFTGTVSRVGGIGLAELHAAAAAARHARFGADAGGSSRPAASTAIAAAASTTSGTPESIASLQRAVRDESHATVPRRSPRRSTDAPPGRDAAQPARAGRGRASRSRSHEVEPSSEIVRRFATGAMSLGSISSEAHETLAIAMNRLGGRSNTGEGGEDPARSHPGPKRRPAPLGDQAGRLGAVRRDDRLPRRRRPAADQGLAGREARRGRPAARATRSTRRSPGCATRPRASGLISPPPHHDIYSIEDLAQLIHDLRCVNPAPTISVKLVAEAGVGTVAAGVAKAKRRPHRDRRARRRHRRVAAVVAQARRPALGARPRRDAAGAASRTTCAAACALQVDGGLRTGRDVLVAALLGAEEFAFSTAPLVAAGCIMMRVCHLNTCPVGIATQDPELRRRFAGTPEQVVHYFLFVAEEVRELLAALGVARSTRSIGRTDLLRAARRRPRRPRPVGADRVAPARQRPAPGLRRPADHGLAAALDRELLAARRRALCTARPVVLERTVHNTDRSVGTFLSGEIVAPGRRRRAARRLDRAAAARHRRPEPRRVGRRAGSSSTSRAPQRLRRQGPLGRAARRAPARERRLRRRAQRDRRQHRAVRRDLGRGLRARARRRALLRAQLGRDRGGRGRRRPRLRVHDGRRRSSCSGRSGATSPPACPAGSPTCYDPDGAARRPLQPRTRSRSSRPATPTSRAARARRAAPRR